MSEIKTVHIIGLGAVGATYASLFHKMNPNSVKIVVDENRFKQYSTGILINGSRYYFDCVVPDKESPEAEFILIATKGHHLPEAIETIKPLVGKNTIILSLLNGITSENDLSSVFGREKVLHGFCVGLDSTRENGEVRFSTHGKIVFGEHYPEAKGKAGPVADLFSRAGISHQIPKDIFREMWWKFMMNVGINQTSAVMGAPYGVYQTIPEARELLASASREVLPLAQKEGIDLNESDISEIFRIINTLSPSGKTSMLQDVEAHRKTEVESFALAVINLGKKHGIETPVNEMLYRLIKVMEARY